MPGLISLRVISTRASVNAECCWGEMKGARFGKRPLQLPVVQNREAI